jgi:hypothetical protein
VAVPKLLLQDQHAVVLALVLADHVVAGDPEVTATVRHLGKDVHGPLEEDFYTLEGRDGGAVLARIRAADLHTAGVEEVQGLIFHPL